MSCWQRNKAILPKRALAMDATIIQKGCSRPREGAEILGDLKLANIRSPIAMPSSTQYRSGGWLMGIAYGVIYAIEEKLSSDCPYYSLH
jgi:hypothetical protein